MNIAKNRISAKKCKETMGCSEIKFMPFSAFLMIANWNLCMYVAGYNYDCFMNFVDNFSFNH